MNVQALPGARVEDAAGHSSIPAWFIDIGANDLGRIGTRVMGIEILVVNEQVKRSRDDFSRLHTTELVARIEHRIASPPTGAGAGSQWTVASDWFDLQEDVSTRSATTHGRPPLPIYLWRPVVLGLCRTEQAPLRLPVAGSTGTRSAPTGNTGRLEQIALSTRSV